MTIKSRTTSLVDVKVTGLNEGADILSNGSELIIGFLQTFKMTCDNNSVHEGAVKQLFPYLMEKLAVAALTARFSLMSKSWHYSVRAEN